MITCGACGFRNGDDRDRCFRCSAALRHVSVPDPGNVKERSDGGVVPRIRLLWFRLAESLSGELPPDVPFRHPFTAGGLSLLLPGAGQLYNRQKLKAAAFLVSGIALWWLAAATIFRWYSNFTLFGLLTFHLWGYADAMGIAVRLNGQFWSWKKSLAALCWLFFCVGVTGMLGQYLGVFGFRLVTVMKDTYDPYLMSGDKLFVAKWPLWFNHGLPKRGDLIFYDPPRYRIEVPSGLSADMFMVNPINGFEKVSAIAGDSLVREGGGPILLNGKPLPGAWAPLRPGGAYGGFHISVPAGRVAALISNGAYENNFGTPSFGGTVGPPSQARGIVLDYDDACVVGNKEVVGVVLFRYNPPQRRTWFGAGAHDP